MSDDEAARLSTVQALVEHRTFDISRSDFAPHTRLISVGGSGEIYADQPPALALLLASVYWVMHRLGLSMEHNSVLVPYLLTLAGATVPVAAAAGLVHRMGRLFELPRHVRAGLALVVVIASGMLSYGVVINPHAPAAALLLAGVTCLIHVATIRYASSRVVWLIVGGALVGVSASIEPAAGVFVVLLVPVVLSIRWQKRYRVGGTLLFLLGATPVMLLSQPWGLGVNELHNATGVTGSGAGSRWFSTFVSQAPTPKLVLPPSAMGADDHEDVGLMTVLWHQTQRDIGRLAAALFGTHGILSHFPVLGLGLLGVGAVMHRNWPAFTKVLALASVGGAMLIVVLYISSDTNWRGAMFANRWMIVATPLLMFWCGAWLRRKHSTGLWVMAWITVAFSLTVAIIGATGPLPRSGFTYYTAVEAAVRLMSDHTSDDASFASDPPETDRP